MKLTQRNELQCTKLLSSEEIFSVVTNELMVKKRLKSFFLWWYEFLVNDCSFFDHSFQRSQSVCVRECFGCSFRIPFQKIYCTWSVAGDHTPLPHTHKHFYIKYIYLVSDTRTDTQTHALNNKTLRKKEWEKKREREWKTDKDRESERKRETTTATTSMAMTLK